MAKKRRWFEQPRPRWIFPAAAGCMLVSAAGAVLSGRTDNMSMGEWTLGPVGILINGVIGLWIVSLFVRMSARFDNPLTRLFSAIGRRSLHIFCVHTVELIGAPWYLFAAQFAASPVTGLVSQYLLRCGFIAAVCGLLELRRRILPPRAKKVRARAERAAERAARPQRYVARH